MLDVLIQILAHADRHDIQWMAQDCVFRDMDLSKPRISKHCSVSIQETMINTEMEYHRHVEMRSGSVIYSDVAEMNVRSLGGEKYFVTFIDEITGFVRDVLMKTSVTGAGLLNKHVMWIKR